MAPLPASFATRATRFVTVLGVGALAVLVTSCGSSSDGASSSAGKTTTTAEQPATTATTTGAAPLSEAEWRKQANAICTETAAPIQEAFGAMDQAEPTPEQLDHVVEVLVSVNRDTEARIDALAEPTSLEGQVKALLDANEKATSAIEQGGPAALDQLDQLFAPVNELATKLGLDACAG